MSMSGRTHKATRVGSAEFKARCLELVNRVKESRVEYIVTRHGNPVARLVPVEAEDQPSLLGSMRGSVLSYERPFDGVPGAWSFNEPARSDD